MATKKDRHIPRSAGFTDRLREAREAAGLTQTQVAAQAGGPGKTLGKTGYSLIELGDRGADLNRVIALAKVLGREPAWLAYDLAGEGGSPEGLGARLLEARRLRGHTQLQLAELAGYTSKEPVRALEAGSQVADVVKAEALARALKVSVLWLAFGLGPLEG